MIRLRRRPRRRRNPRAFTLIEFIAVMTIIGILAALIVPRFFGRIGAAKQAVAQQKIAVLEAKVLEFQADCGRFPTAQEGLRALLRAPSDVAAELGGFFTRHRLLQRERDALLAERALLRAPLVPPLINRQIRCRLPHVRLGLPLPVSQLRCHRPGVQLSRLRRCHS